MFAARSSKKLFSNGNHTCGPIRSHGRGMNQVKLSHTRTKFPIYFRRVCSAWRSWRLEVCCQKHSSKNKNVRRHTSGGLMKFNLIAVDFFQWNPLHKSPVWIRGNRWKPRETVKSTLDIRLITLPWDLAGTPSNPQSSCVIPMVIITPRGGEKNRKMS